MKGKASYIQGKNPHSWQWQWQWHKNTSFSLPLFKSHSYNNKASFPVLCMSFHSSQTHKGKEMEQKRTSSSSLFSSSFSCGVMLFLIFCFSSLGSVVVVVEGYKNYTVGDSLGWFDNSEKPDVNYQKWASTKVFSLGDFLIFNTDTNHSVVQTYNLTTYKLCDYDDAQDKDTIQWSSSNPSNTETQPVSVAVPLTKEGSTYFFSSDYDGDQCKSGGQHFQINVTHGQGLPKSMKNPTEDNAPSPASPVSGDDESAPDTIVPANFNHPKDQSGDDSGDNDEKDKSSSDSVSVSAQFSRKLYGSVVLLGLVFLI